MKYFKFLKEKTPSIKTFFVTVDMHKVLDRVQDRIKSGDHAQALEDLFYYEAVGAFNREAVSQFHEDLERGIIKGIAQEMLKDYNFKAVLERIMLEKMTQIVNKF